MASNHEENGTSEATIYDPEILQRLSVDSFRATYKNGVTPLNPGENLILRPLRSGDYDRGYMQLLSQLTSVGDVTREQFEQKFTEMKNSSNQYYVTVIEDSSLGQVIGSATLVKEQKFIHGCNPRGRVEDVIVNDDYRGKQLGKVLVDVLVSLSKELGCYKVSLECKDDKFARGSPGFSCR